MKTRGVLWGLAFACLVVVASLFSGDKGTENPMSSTYNPDKPGVKAFYTLMHRMNYPVGRLEKDYSGIPKNTSILIQVQPGGTGALRAHTPGGYHPDLLDWVRSGGVLVALADNGAGVQSQLRKSQMLGKGEVVYFNVRFPITNEAMKDPRNAVQMLRVVDSHFHGSGRILFDEYAHGFSDSPDDGFTMGRHVWAALAIAAVCGLVLLHSRGKRFGAVRSMDNAEAIRPGFEYVEAVGRMYQRAHAHGVAVGVLGQSFRKKLCRKLGVSSDLGREPLVAAVGSEYGQSTAERVSVLMDRCEGRGLDSVSGDHLLKDIAVEICGLEQELGIERTRS